MRRGLHSTLRRPLWCPGSRRLSEVHGIVVFACLLVALLCVPIPLGSNRPVAWFAWETGVYGLLTFWSFGLLVGADRPRLSTASSRILTLLAVWLALIFLQTVSIPGAFVAVLSPVVHALQMNLGLISIAAPKTLSVDPGNSYNELLKYGSYVAVFVLTLATVTTKNRLLTAVGLVIIAGALESMFAIYSHTTGYVIFPESYAANELRAGTFVNRNHFANLLTMCLGLTLGLLTAIVNSQPESSRLRFGMYKDVDLAVFLLILVAALLMVAGIFLSGSRAPLVLFSMSVAVMLAVARLGSGPRTGEMVLAPLVLLGAVAVVVGMGFQDSFLRLVDRDLMGGERMLQNAWGLKLLSTVWIAGVGVGNYQWVFPMFRGDDLRFVTYDHAHNDYLQTAIEQGIPVAAVLGLAVLFIVRELYRGYRRRRNPLIRGVIFGCLMSTGFMLLHALVDFSFRIPANATYFFAVSAIGIAACRIERGRRWVDKPAEKSGVDQ